MNTQIQDMTAKIKTLTGDEKAIAEAIMAWVVEKRDEAAGFMLETTQRYNEEFNRRKREKQEELFWQSMD